MKTLANISRILVGVLFIISGFIKANDPLGFSYKLDEYFDVFHIEWLSHISLALAILICAAEIGLGVATLMGAKMNFTSWALLLMIIFFTFLTFYSWHFKVVNDCGCFGDALHLKPLQSFEKDLVLLVLILFIFIGRNSISPLLGNMISTVVSWLGFAASLLFSIHCYRHLPVIDFRPYKVGTDIIHDMKSAEELGLQAPQYAVDYHLKNKKTGEEKVVLSSDYVDKKMWLDTTWGDLKADTDQIKVSDGYVTPIEGFSISDANDSNITQRVLDNPDYYFFLVAYNINKTNEKVQGRINDFVALCDKDNKKFIGLTGSSHEDVDVFRHNNNSMFPYYNVDPTVLKTIIRSNPGLMLMKQGKVIAKWHYNDFPSYSDVKQKYFNK